MPNIDAIPEDFIDALLKDFQNNGDAVIEQLRERNPKLWLALIAAISVEDIRADGRQKHGD